MWCNELEEKKRKEKEEDARHSLRKGGRCSMFLFPGYGVSLPEERVSLEPTLFV